MKALESSQPLDHVLLQKGDIIEAVSRRSAPVQSSQLSVVADQLTCFGIAARDGQVQQSRTGQRTGCEGEGLVEDAKVVAVSDKDLEGNVALEWGHVAGVPEDGQEGLAKGLRDCRCVEECFWSKVKVGVCVLLPKGNELSDASDDLWDVERVCRCHVGEEGGECCEWGYGVN